MDTLPGVAVRDGLAARAQRLAFPRRLFVLPIALLYAYLRDGKSWRLVALVFVMSLGHLVHPSMFVLLVVPMTAMYLRAARSLGWKGHVGIVTVAVTVIGTNAWWLATAFRFAH